MNFRTPVLAALAVGLPATAFAASHTAPGAERFTPTIQRLSRAHGVPERLIRRVIMRESRYAPHVRNGGHYGLMQIKLQTAKGMGYSGGAAGLLDGETNLTYAVPYLANAYVAAGHNEDRAVALYAGGYYYVAKSKGLLPKLRTARSEPLAGEPAPSAPVTAYAEIAPREEAPQQQAAAGQPGNPFAALFGGQQVAQAPVEAEGDDARMEEASMEIAPLPPKRPHRL